MGKALPLAKKRFLLAEDDFLIAQDIRTAVEQAGGRIEATEQDAIELEEVIEQTKFDCAILDVQLLNGSSVKVAKLLKARTVPFILVTAYERTIVPPELRDVPFVAKPFSRDSLVEAVASTFH